MGDNLVYEQNFFRSDCEGWKVPGVLFQDGAACRISGAGVQSVERPEDCLELAGCCQLSVTVSFERYAR